MKKALGLLIALLMVFQSIAVFAETADQPVVAEELPQEETVEVADGEEDSEEEIPSPVYDYDELVVGTTTPFSGSFFTDMWGYVSSDLDIRLLVHAYNLVEWSVVESAFDVDSTVVTGIIAQQNGAGDHIYTLSLADDLYYSDGTQITAWDYAFSFLLNCAPEVSEIGGSLKSLDYIVGYDAYESGEVPYLSGVRVLTDDTLAIYISGEYLPYFYEMALLDCVPYPISIIAPGCRVADDGNGVYITNIDETIEEPIFTAELLEETILNEETGYLSHPSVSSGAYTITAYDGTQVEMALNEYYKGDYDGNLPTIPRLIYKTISNETMVDELARGELGLINKCASLEALQRGTAMTAQSDDFTFRNYMRSGMSFIAFCCENAPVDSLAIRQAIAMCLDKDGLVNDSVGNYGNRVDGYYGLGQWMYQLVDGTQVYPLEVPDESADSATVAAYDEALASWQALSLENVRVYDLNVDEAVNLLVSEGWTLNREGEEYDPEEDDVRCKDIDGEIVPLELKMLCPEGSGLNAYIQTNFTDHLAEAGILLTVDVLPMSELVKYYYRRTDRTEYQMIMLATNFNIVFDPSSNFRPDGEDSINRYNFYGINDQELYDLTVTMRQTEPGDSLAYCQNWIAFEERLQETVPLIGIYSNVYFDFYARVLHNYEISDSITWGQAIVASYMSDVSDDELLEDDMGIPSMEEEDFEIIG